MQKPVTPTWEVVTASLASRKSTAPPMSFTAWSTLSAIMSLPASSGSELETEAPW